MSRKKISKTKAKKTTNKAKNQKKTSSILSMEKELRSLPAKLIKQLRKESARLKKAESTTQSSLKKMQAQKKVITNKQNTLSAKLKDKRSTTVKNQLFALKKNSAKTDRNIAQLTAELTTTKNQSSVISQKQAEILYISKEIAQLDKKTKTKPAKPTIKSSKKTRTQAVPLEPQYPTEKVEEFIDSSLHEPAEMES